ncbi:10450_t:CDS:2, partial [Entrophospora sp. SA101]
MKEILAEILYEICNYLTPLDLYSLSSVCKQYRKSLWSSAPKIQKIWERSRIVMLEYPNFPPPNGMSEQEYVWFTLIADKCSICSVKLNPTFIYRYWQFKIHCCCLLESTISNPEDDKEEDLNLYNNDNVPNIISYINNIINDINNDINEIGNHINIINHHSDDNISSYNNTRSSNNTFLLDNTYSYNNTRSSNTSLLDIVTNNTFNISYSSFSYPKEIFECLIAINHPALVGNSKFKKLYWAKEVESAYNEWSNLAVADDYDDKNSISSRREEWLKLKQERLHNLHL